MSFASTVRVSEWPSLRLGFLAATTMLVLVFVGGGTAALLEDEPSRFERVEQCLRREKLLDVAPTTGGPIAAEAGGGALATRIEGNGLHLAIADSEEEAQRIIGLYRAVSGPLAGRLEQRRAYVFLWEGVATPTQRQIVYECTGFA
jgi:hypothetical protein